MNKCASYRTWGYNTWAHTPTMPIWRSLARSQLRVQQPRARLSPARSRHRCIIDFSVTSRMWGSSIGPQPATLMIFNGQQPTISAPFSESKFTKRGDLLPPGLPPCQISSPCVNHTSEISLTKACGQTQKQ